MTPRPLARTRRAALSLAVLGLTSLAGCDPRSIVFFLQPFDPVVSAPAPTLKGKRVVVLTKATTGTQGDFVAIDREMSRELVKILRQNVKRIDVVDPEKVFKWDQDHPTWTDPADAANFFEADAVVFVEIEQFQVSSPSSPDMYEGKSRIHIQLQELKHPKDSRGKDLKDKPREPEKTYDANQDTNFPIRGPMPTESGVSRSSFKNKFLKLVVMEVSWHFIDHAPGDNIQDTRFGGN
jgi:hypothetical protein